jgi:FixJ family two-component response regulator/anti-sigma regulatory factor (Ser/Thr protein kinase)
VALLKFWWQWADISGMNAPVAIPPTSAPQADRRAEPAAFSREDVARVLIVDDDSFTRSLLHHAAKLAGHDAVSADSAASARDIIETDGAASFDCVVADYLMPGETGLQLLHWLQAHDASLAVIIVTGNSERDVITAMLRGGAIDFLDKPIDPDAFVNALNRAIGETLCCRAGELQRAAVRAMGEMQHQAILRGVAGTAAFDVRYRALRDVGGDFLMRMPLEDDGELLLVGDVAGHDVRSSYAAAYFQGLAFGALANGQPLRDMLQGFNRTLVEEWNAVGFTAAVAPITSVSVCAVEFDASRLRVAVSNAGFPNPCRVSRDGRVTEIETARTNPLGWFVNTVPRSTHHTFEAGETLLLWTDGLCEVAERNGVSPLAMTTVLMNAEATRSDELLRDAPDDVLVVSLPMDRRDAPEASAHWDPWWPVLMEEMPGADHGRIDALQANWEHQLRFVVPGMSEARLLDILLVLRESVLNAMCHGCNREARRSATLTVCLRLRSRLLRATIEDAGEGHDFDPAQHHDGADLAEFHRGLALINNLASSVKVARRGSRLTIDVRY